MNTITIIGTEIFDNASFQNEDGMFQISEVSVGVDFDLDGTTYSLDYQTSITHDAGAFSSLLRSYDEGTSHQDLAKLIDDDAAFGSLLELIAKKADVQKIWEDYINETYVKNEDHFGGIDGNSEHMWAKKRI